MAKRESNKTKSNAVLFELVMLQMCYKSVTPFNQFTIVFKVNVNVANCLQILLHGHSLITFAQAQFFSDIISHHVIISLLSGKFRSRCMKNPSNGFQFCGGGELPL